MELTEQTSEAIRNLTIDPDAEIISALDSRGTVYWSDEIIDARFLDFFCTELECEQIRRLFAIRYHYWDTGDIGHDDRLYWNESHRQFPNWPIFQRLDLSLEQRKEVEAGKRLRELLVKCVVSLADEIEVITEGGVEYGKAVFNRKSLLKEMRKRGGWRWWRWW